MTGAARTAARGLAARRGAAFRLTVVLLLVALPLFLGPYPISALSRILAFALLAASLDLLTGYTGLASLGHAAYFGVGAYTAALIGIHLTPNAPVQLLAALAAGGIAAGLTGWVAVRTHGTFFLMLTLAVGEIVHQLADSWTSLTGGSNGLVGMPPITVLPGRPLVLAGFVYWYILAIFVLCYAVLRRITASPFGRTMRGVRDNEARMRAVGYDTARVKYVVYCIAGAVAGAAGSLWVAQTRFVSPADLSFEIAALVLLAVVIGGSGSLWGPCLGAALVLLVNDTLSSYVAGRGPLLLGLAFVAAVYLLPRGFAGLRGVRVHVRTRETGP
ncbi:MAG: branched-chain amino acid ABC transporter permease [Streptosporangiales bacterium]|nr:branched-chain amino acid ABC transporter permease [Streptosporangiales bacterium]